MKIISGLGWATKVAFALVVVALVVSVGYLVWDSSDSQTGSVLDYEAERFKEYLEKNPNNPAAWIELASISLQQKKYDKAISEYEQALDLGGAQPAVLLGLGLAYMKKGAADQAVDYLDQAVTLNETGEIPQSAASVATLHYYLGKIYLETGEIDLAAEELAESLAYNRINADAIFLQGQVFEARGDSAAAEDNYLRALSLVPNYAEVYSQLGNLYEERGDESIAAYNHAMAALFSGEVVEAVEQINAVIDSLSQNADAYWGLGWGYEKMNMMEEAIDAYQQAVTIDPKHQLSNGALTRLGVGLYQE